MICSARVRETGRVPQRALWRTLRHTPRENGAVTDLNGNLIDGFNITIIYPSDDPNVKAGIYAIINNSKITDDGFR